MSIKSLTLFGKLLALSNKHSVRLLEKRGEESTETTEVNELTFCSVEMDDSKNESVKLIDQPHWSTVVHLRWNHLLQLSQRMAFLGTGLNIHRMGTSKQVVYKMWMILDLVQGLSQCRHILPAWNIKWGNRMGISSHTCSKVSLHSCSRIKMADSWYQQSTNISSLLDIRKTSKEVQSSLGM